MKATYGKNFYSDRHRRTHYAASEVLSHVLEALPPVGSAIDFGCGVGTWLSILHEKGVHEIQGLDGPWVDLNLLAIPRERFRQVDFRQAICCDRRYDLAITLEVAEHLAGEHARAFVESVANASDFVLFSAAIPHQGGRGHVNEQWPDYWADLFAAQQYVALDFLRTKIWNDEKIPLWYRQNILLFVRRSEIHRIRGLPQDDMRDDPPRRIVHPDLYLSKVRQMSSIRGSGRLFLKALVKRITRRNVAHSSEPGRRLRRDRESAG